MFVDIHCHLLPGIDDGADDLATAIQMARLAVQDGTSVALVTPHQMDRYRHNTATIIRDACCSLQHELQKNDIELQLLPGGDVRIEADFFDRLDDDTIMTLADQRRHVLLELPHELYFPIENLVKRLQALGMTGILSHPERNAGLMQSPKIIDQLVDLGCLMQVTAGSINGSFGPECAKFSKQLLKNRLVHFVASDGHGIKRRRPTLRRAFEKSIQWIGIETAEQIFFDYPNRVALGKSVPLGKLCAANQGRPIAREASSCEPTERGRPNRKRWFGWTKAARTAQGS